MSKRKILRPRLLQLTPKEVLLDLIALSGGGHPDDYIPTDAKIRLGSSGDRWLIEIYWNEPVDEEASTKGSE